MDKNTKVLPPDDWWLDRNNEILDGPIGMIKIGKIYAISQSNDGSATGEFIIKAAKCHNELVEALKALVEVCPCQNNCPEDDMSCATNRAKVILKKAEK